MLIMKCPKCNKYIHSALLAEIKSIDCEHCGVDVPVTNVLISSNGFTFDRDDLVKRFYRYRKLLDEVIDERNSLADNSRASDTSKRSIEQFMELLQEMMTGARDNFRYEFTIPLSAKLHYGENTCHGTFFNLSTEGACISIPRSNPLPQVGGDILIEFSLPDDGDLFSIHGRIRWTQKAKETDEGKHSIGIKFNELDSATHTELWLFISILAGDAPS